MLLTLDMEKSIDFYQDVSETHTQEIEKWTALINEVDTSRGTLCVGTVPISLSGR